MRHQRVSSHHIRANGCAWDRISSTTIASMRGARGTRYKYGADDARARRLEDINKHCLNEFRYHWNCLESKNHQLWKCRRAERVLNKCVFDKIVRRPWTTFNFSRHDSTSASC